jgi:tryptophan synthase alpha chain
VSRLGQIFAKARAERRKALVLYLTAGDPDLRTSGRLMLAAAEAGADIIEVGIPWSDPSADGLAIQAAMGRALSMGGGIRSTLELTRSLRRESPDVGLVLFGYANPIEILGPAVFAREARDAGADAVLCVDYPIDEDDGLISTLRKSGLDYIPLLAPTSTPQRIALAATGSGFIYYVSLTGVTGHQLGELASPRLKVETIREAAGSLPIVVGFGIKTPAEARSIAAFADGVVVGSAAIRIIEEAVAARRDPVPDLVAFVRALRDALTF